MNTNSELGLVLTHGAGSNADAPLLVAVGAAFEKAGYRVVRHTLYFRTVRGKGPPHPKNAPMDQAGLLEAVLELQRDGCQKVYLGGHSYGARQASIVASTHPGLAAGLLLLSYPLHPPEKPDQLRTAHFPALRTPSIFFHGAKDPFGTEQEMKEALELMPARTELVMVPGEGHDLSKAKTAFAAMCLERFQRFTAAL